MEFIFGVDHDAEHNTEMYRLSDPIIMHTPTSIEINNAWLLKLAKNAGVNQVSNMAFFEIKKVVNFEIEEILKTTFAITGSDIKILRVDDIYNTFTLFDKYIIYD